MTVFLLFIFFLSITSLHFLSESVGPPQSYFNNQGLLKHTANITDIPHHVLIVYGNLYCSGSLIRSKIVISAASCISKNKNNKVFVKLGSVTTTGEGQIIPVLEVKVHEYFKYRSTMDNDIAMLLLKHNVIFGENVKKAVLVETDSMKAGTIILVSGWGSMNLPAKYVSRLLWSEMTLANRIKCEEVYGDIFTTSMFCAEYQTERRLSDNGGPAVHNKHVLIGILSFGATRKEAPHFAVFTNVSYFHRWIEKNVKFLLKKYCTIRKIFLGSEKV